MKIGVVLILVLLVSFLAGTAAADTESLGSVSIPSLRLYKPVEFIPLVNRGYDLSELGYGVGFLEGTSWEDVTWGRTVLVGHTPGAFSDLVNIQSGEYIYLLTDNYTLTYQVTYTQVVQPSATDILAPTNQPTLVLITCINGTQQRFVVEASLVKYIGE